MSLTDRGGTDLLGYLAVLRRRKWLVIGVVAVVVVSAVAFALSETRIYQASTRLLIQPDRSILTPNQASPGSDFVAIQMQVIQSSPVQAMVQASLGTAPKVSITPVGTSSIVEIRAQDANAVRAAQIANAYVDAYLKYRQQQTSTALATASTEIQTRIDSLQKQIDALGSRLATLPPCSNDAATSNACTQRSSLQQDRDAVLSQQVPLRQQLDQLRVNSSISTGTEVVLRASPPRTPVRPTPVRDGLLALGVGLVLGLALAFLFEYLDDSIKSKEDLETAGNLPVLALIPSVQGWKQADRTELVAQTDPTSPVAEAYRTLRTSINFLIIDRPLRSIQVTSAGTGEGKTTTAANLAVVLARAGERVIAVSCDLRRPRLHKFFGLSNDIGFTSVLLGEAQLSAALQPVANEGRLWVMASGPVPPNPSELLSSQRASEVLSGLVNSADIVIIDCPPVLPVTDASVLSNKVDATLLVVTAGSSTNKRLTRAMEMLRQVGAPLIGTVLNKVPDESAYVEQYRYYKADPPTRKSFGNGAKSSTDGADSAQSSLVAGSGKRITKKVSPGTKGGTTSNENPSTP